jgi:two-component system chemotaxis response regulator CheB
MVGSQPGLEVVATACCLADALKVLRNVMVDVVLLDIEMPAEAGSTVFPEIIEAGRGAKVLLVSSAADRERRRATARARAGAADTHLKPVSGLFGGRSPKRWRAAAPHRPRRARCPTPSGQIPLREVATGSRLHRIGASTGGIHAINEFVGRLPRRTGVRSS